MTGKRKRKVGLIGAGLQGKRRAETLKQFGETEDLVIVADVNFEEAKLLADEMGCRLTTVWEEVITSQDVDVVLVCTPPHLHLPMSLAALHEGKHVFCEKPLARNPEEAEQIVDTARRIGVKLKCGFNLRHHPGIQRAQRYVSEGDIGEPIFVRCRYGISGRPGYEKEWRANPDVSGGGQLMDQGMHAFDLARYFLGEFSEVFGFLQTGFWDIGALEDNAYALLRNEKGQVANLHASWTQWKNLFSFELFGRDGYVIVEGLGGSYGTEKAIMGRRAFLEPFREEVTEFRGEDRSWHEEWVEFISAIEENREPSGNGYDGLQALRLAYAVYESARSGCVVRTQD